SQSGLGNGLVTSSVRGGGVMLGLALAVGCASLRTNNSAVCEWLEVEAQPGLTFSGQRGIRDGHVGPHQCGTTDTYKLIRSGYSLEIWNGEETHPRLFLRVSTPQGEPLRLDSPEIESVDVAGQTAYFKKAMAFQYVLLMTRPLKEIQRPLVFPYTLTVAIVGASGEVIGRESITMTKRVGRFQFDE
ncbi:MAG: hypothetical protein R2708_27270, partial [Vicinamibacterales bacterium]